MYWQPNRRKSENSQDETLSIHNEGKQNKTNSATKPSTPTQIAAEILSNPDHPEWKNIFESIYSS